MKRLLIVALVFFTVLGSAWADFFSKAEAGPWSGSITAGMIIDLGGMALVMTGGMLPSVDLDLLDAGVALIHVGALVMTGGGALWTGGMSSRESDYALGGISAGGAYRGRSWTLVGLSAACVLGGIATSVALPNLEGAIIGLILSGTGAIIEIINAYGSRLPWRDALDKAWLSQKELSADISISPSLAFLPSGASAESGRGLGAGGISLGLRLSYSGRAE